MSWRKKKERKRNGQLKNLKTQFHDRIPVGKPNSLSLVFLVFNDKKRKRQILLTATSCLEASVCVVALHFISTSEKPKKEKFYFALIKRVGPRVLYFYKTETARPLIFYFIANCLVLFDSEETEE